MIPAALERDGARRGRALDEGGGGRARVAVRRARRTRLRRRRVLGVEQHPNADRLGVCTVDAGDGERTIVCGAPNVAAGQTVPVALPGAVLPAARELGEAKLRGRRVERDDPLARPSWSRDGLATGSSSSHGRRAREARDAALAEVLADRRPGPRARPQPQPLRLPGRLRRRPRGPRDHRRAARARALGGGRRAERGGATPSDYASVTVEVPDLCPRFTARVFDGRRGRALAALAQGTAIGGRPAADLERRRHHQLRDAADRAAAPRVRPRPRTRRRARSSGRRETASG